ncbi:exopolyphosphatase [Desulfuromonas versatilis]|uniref:Exopolyphosphatase n=1 Tax=Desulfuromonas versatilis TaxID=2802975 RepID=A0ABM8HSR3_9BACT|nr:Ppx/GppA phosphatase family protein [Desulfuromonas versatilis]BCR05013.1 exopolyphosphatase [Desulfuromonas versatilis]
MLAAIDVGSNTLRLLLGEVRQGLPVPIAYHRQITRLAGGFTEEEGLAPAAMERTLSALRRFAALAGESGVTRIRAVGTEALRRAVNAGAFLRQVQQSTGLRIEVIGGAEEALLSAAGVFAALEPRPAASLVFDIGGGSTEFVLVEAGRVRFRQSFSLGVVRLCERLPDAEEQRSLIHTVIGDLQSSLAAAGMVFPRDWALVGTAGTVTTLAALDLEMAEYDWRRVNNHRIGRARLQQLQQLLDPLQPAERERLPGMEEGRGDLIMPGLAIVQALLERFARQESIVSDFGLLEGVLLSLGGEGQ